MKKPTLLYIEDDESQSRELSHALRDRGYDVFRAASGEEGLELLSHQPVDLVLCDLNMPGLGGIEVLHEIKEKSPRVPVLILTSRGTIELAVTIALFGYSHYRQHAAHSACLLGGHLVDVHLGHGLQRQHRIVRHLR